MNLYAFFDELEKIGGALGRVSKAMANLGGRNEVAGLTVLALPSLDDMQARARIKKGQLTEHNIERNRLIKSRFHAPLEVTGLGMLAAPYVGKRLSTGSWGH